MTQAPAAVVVDGLRKQFVVGSRWFGARRAVQAVSGVSFQVEAGHTLGIVGESGCGKSTLARLLMGLIAADGGQAVLAGQPLGPRPQQLAALRRKVQMVFQDSYASLNPRMTVEASIMFGPLVQGVPRRAARQTAHGLMERVALEPGRYAERYPHEISGGQRQRVNIARALALQPEIVIFDEAVSALDKSVELQVLNLLMDLKQSLGLTYLFISHDLHVVQYVSDRVLVMYLGQVVETGPVDAVYAQAAHPYTRALLASMPSMDPRRRTLAAPIAGDPPSPIDPPSGCRFRTRCPHADSGCAVTVPRLQPVGDRGHQAACLRLPLPGAGV
jgi:peptide/nickel transport system ATP-binding protein